MAHLHAHERGLEQEARSVALTLVHHPDWKKDALALRDRLDALIDKEIAASNPASIPDGSNSE